MKEYYGDAILQDEKNRENIEFFNSEDILSARTLNRPIRELYEEMDRLKNEINNLDRKLYGNLSNGMPNKTIITPGVFEGFNKNNFNFDPENNHDTFSSVGTLLGDDIYIRIPTGLFCVYYNPTDLPSVPELQSKKDFYRIHTYPQKELFERELAEHFAIDLNDTDNDIKVEFCGLETVDTVKTVPKYKVHIKRTYAAEDTPDVYSYKSEEITLPLSEVQGQEQYYHSMFEIVNGLKSKFIDDRSVYLRKNDDNFSLEDIVSLKFDDIYEQGNYYLFAIPFEKELCQKVLKKIFDPQNLENLENFSDNINFSKSNRFFIYKNVDNNKLSELKNYFIPILSFEIDRVIQNENNTTIIITNAEYCENIEEEKDIGINSIGFDTVWANNGIIGNIYSQNVQLKDINNLKSSKIKIKDYQDNEKVSIETGESKFNKLTANEIKVGNSENKKIYLKGKNSDFSNTKNRLTDGYHFPAVYTNGESSCFEYDVDLEELLTNIVIKINN